MILKILVDYCKHQRQDLDKLFGLLKAFEHRTAYDLSFLKNFFKYYID